MSEAVTLIGVAVVAYLFGKNREVDTVEPTTNPSEPSDSLVCVYPQIKTLRAGTTDEYVCALDPDFSPPQSVDDGTAKITWENVYEFDGRIVWKHGVLMGLLFDTGVDERYYEYHYLIGSSDHSSFVHESQTDFGHLQIDGAWAKAYADEAAAIAEVDRLGAPDDTGTGPVLPEPEDDGDTDDGGGFNLQPSTGFGDNGYSSYYGGI